MIITCPNCTTRYNVQPALIGKGRLTRCYNCGHSWHQEPVVSPPPPPMQAPPPPATPMAPGPAMAQAMPQNPYMAPQPPMPQAMPQPMAAAQTAYAAPMPMEQPVEAPQPAVIAPEPPAPEPVAEPDPLPDPEPLPELEPEPEPDLDLDQDIEPEPEPEIETESEDGPEPLADADLDSELDFDLDDAVDDADTGPISPDDLDAMFGDDEEAETVSSVMEVDDSDAPPDDIDPEDLPEPDPIPEVFSPDDSADGEAPKSRKGLIIGGAVAAVLIIILGTGYFARNMIMDMVPFTKGIYETLGIKEELGLAIGNQGLERGSEGGKEVLYVTGEITNITDETRAVPMINVYLLDGEGKEIQSSTAPPLRSELPPKRKMKFRVVVSDPSPLARKVSVVLKNPPEDG